MKQTRNYLLAATVFLCVQAGAQQTQFNNVRIGEMGHGAGWGGISHTSQATANNYSLIQSTDGHYTLLNKANTGAGYIGFRVGNTDRAVITNAGNMGIGTTAPAYRLDVAGDIIASSWLRTRGNTGWYNESYGGGWFMADNVWIRSYGSKNVYVDRTIRMDGDLQVGPDGNRLIVNGTGNTGIGINTPGEKLHVMGNVKSQSAVGAARLYFQSPYARWNWETGNGNENTAILTRWAANGTDGRQTMTVQYDGNVRIHNLAGAGNRMVVADGNGLLFTQPIPSGGGTFNGNLASTLNVTIPYDEMIHLTRQNATGINKDYWFKIGGDRAFVIADGGTPIARYLPSNYANGSCYNQWQFRGELRVKSDLSTSCPDYVFEEDYALPSLEEKEAYIKKHKHLPDVPAAKEVAENGVPVTEMSFGQLKNLEELYLNVIQLKKELDQLKKENTEIKKQLQTVKK
ncbi:MAG: shufflon system plasmid conjugative transfer pilus tip adhesin PilV [Dinghuibacter sp.]|nr:shufflon system plasmid conjugative transfer pilus tip adhesin PilV [Dinghuibacter sp.]